MMFTVRIYQNIPTVQGVAFMLCWKQQSVAHLATVIIELGSVVS